MKFIITISITLTFSLYIPLVLVLFPVLPYGFRIFHYYLFPFDIDNSSLSNYNSPNFTFLFWTIISSPPMVFFQFSTTGITFSISGVGSIELLVVMIRTVDRDSVYSNVIFRPGILSTFS